MGGMGRLALVVAVGMLCASAMHGQSVLHVKKLRCEYKVDPLGIDVGKPRLSWQLDGAEKNVMQTSYEVRVARSQGDLAKGKLIWTSGKIESDASAGVEYAGAMPESRQIYYWQVRVADNHGHLSEWSEAAKWEMGLLETSQWKAKWITPDWPVDEAKTGPVPLLRKEFSVKKKVARARLYATAMGLYEMELNGKRVGNAYFTPGWTEYDFRFQYQTYDVTEGVKSGANCLGAMLGEGWFRGTQLWEPKRNVWGKHSALLAQLVITYTDGTEEVVGSDESWKASTGAILTSEIYNGETYDARLEKSGWSEARYDDKEWKGVRVLEVPFEAQGKQDAAVEIRRPQTARPQDGKSTEKGKHEKDSAATQEESRVKLVAQAGPLVKEIEQVKPVKVFSAPNGETVLDMGQNMVGWMRFRLSAPAGTTVTLRHAEVLDENGNLYTANLRSAKQTIRYTAKGGGIEEYEPHFTFQGFRYVGISGWPGAVKPEDFTDVVVHSAMERTGTFETSNALLNQLEHNIIWGQKGNFLEVPTDCPQRDERLGWTGDAQVFAPTASFNFETVGFYEKWLKDMALDQEDDGAVPHVIPNVLSHESRKGSAASAGWSDAAVVVPWTVYQAYGDRRVIEEQYPSMKAWVEYMRRQAGDKYIWSSGFSFGDWLAFATTRSDYPGATTDKDYLQTAYFARSTALLAKTARVLGKTEEAAEYAGLEEKIKGALLREFVTANGRISPNTQTAYAIALAFDLLPESMRVEAAARLAADVKKFEHLTTGFLGTPVLCAALSENGYLDEAYLLLNRTDYPSWLYPVSKGATTIWERWDGIKPNGSFQDPGMNSFNHYAYGAIGEWMYATVAGIRIDEERPGYKHIRIEPRPGGGLKFAKASVESVYGRVASGWEIVDGKMKLTVEIPTNTTATVKMPSGKTEEVGSGQWEFEEERRD